ncbi:hypothetical protein [Mucilaginibacter sp. HD30]
MTKQAIIEHTIDVINQLPEDEATKIAEFADLLIESENKLVAMHARLKQMREELIVQMDELTFNENVQSMASNSAFDFLKDEEELYTESDLKEVYGKR